MTLPASLRSALDGLDRIHWTISPEYAALSYFDHAISMNKYLLYPYFMKSLCYQEINDQHKQVDIYNILLGLEVDKLERDGLGWEWLGINPTDENIDIVEFTSEIYRSEGLLYRAICDVENAIASFKKIVDLNPNYKDIKTINEWIEQLEYDSCSVNPNFDSWVIDQFLYYPRIIHHYIIPSFHI
jgi:tetratricopeptide (TPR) repeat protein